MTFNLEKSKSLLTLIIAVSLEYWHLKPATVDSRDSTTEDIIFKLRIVSKAL